MSIQLDAQTAHGRLRRALATLREAECSAVTLFAEIMRRRLFRELGFASIHIYAGEALGFSRSKTYQFIHLAESLGKLPRLKAGLESGKLSWTKAREVVKVATPKTEKRWLEIAASKSRRELEDQVALSRASRDRAQRDPGQGELLANPSVAEAAPSQAAPLQAMSPQAVPPQAVSPQAAPPQAVPPQAAPVQSLSLRLEPMQRARFDSLVEALMKRHHRSREEIVLMAMEAMLAGGKKYTRVDSGTPYQVIVHQCETCAASAVGPERRTLSAVERAQVECDLTVLEPGKRNRRSIPPSRRRAVLLRDGHRCRVRGCGRASFLEIHHLKARSRGGGNREENLIAICSTCHAHLHERGGESVPLSKL
jgi:5-methylcytosine-specific restriction endonuclease McrA